LLLAPWRNIEEAAEKARHQKMNRRSYQQVQPLARGRRVVGFHYSPWNHRKNLQKMSSKKVSMLLLSSRLKQQRQMWVQLHPLVQLKKKAR
jgi:hypothetical protein